MKPTSEVYQANMESPFRRPSHIRITLTSDGVDYVFADNAVLSATRTQDVDPLSRRLPTESFEFTVADFDQVYNPSNPTGRWAATDENAPVMVEYGYEAGGEIEWLDPDYYELDGRPEASSNQASFKASSHLRHLTNKFYKYSLGVLTFYGLAEAILTDAGVTDYEIDESLENYEMNAVVPIDTHANLLQMVAHAMGCALYTQGTTIHIKKLDFTEASIEGSPITLRSIALGGDVVTKTEPLYKVQAYKYNYTNDLVMGTVFKALIDVDGELDFHCEFTQAASNTFAQISSGGTISNYTAYARAADFKISGTGTFTVTVGGYLINTSTDMAEAVASLNVNGGTDVENNPLITNDSTRSALMFRTAQYLLLRITHTIEYRGAPEYEALDGVLFSTFYGTNAEGMILKHTLNFNGALSGELIIKSISENRISNAILYDDWNAQVLDSRGKEILVLGLEPYYSAYNYIEMDDFITEVLG